MPSKSIHADSRTGAGRFAAGVMAFALILLSRHPAVLTHARFYAEDGWVFYPDAYDLGWRSLFIARVGYLELFERLIALATQPFPLAWAPTLFALAGVSAQVLPAAFLVSRRMDDAWPCRRARVAFALVYLALPHMDEVYVNLTNTQWHLAILGFLVIIADSPRRWPATAFDAMALTVAGLSGPFAVMLAPIALWQFLATRDRATLWRGLIVVTAAAIQVSALLVMMRERQAGPLGATPMRLVTILATQVFLGPLLNRSSLATLRRWPDWSAGWAALPVCLVGLIFIAMAMRRGPPALRKVIVLATLVLAAALIRPQISVAHEQWAQMTEPGVGARYFEVPALAWIAVLFTLVRHHGARIAALALLGVMAVGISNDWPARVAPPNDFPAQARVFAAAPPGTRMTFDVGPGPAMTLVRKP